MNKKYLLFILPILLISCSKFDYSKFFYKDCQIFKEEKEEIKNWLPDFLNSIDFNNLIFFVDLDTNSCWGKFTSIDKNIFNYITPYKDSKSFNKNTRLIQRFHDLGLSDFTNFYSYYDNTYIWIFVITNNNFYFQSMRYKYNEV